MSSETVIEPGRFAEVRAAQKLAKTGVANMSDADVFARQGISESALKTDQLVDDVAETARRGLRRVLVSKAMYERDQHLPPEEQTAILDRQKNKYYRLEIGDPHLRGIVDAPHGGPIKDEIYWAYKERGISVWDRFTNRVASAVKNRMIPKKTRAHNDTNRLSDDPAVSHTQSVEGAIVAHEPNLNAIKAQRDAMAEFLASCDNLDESGQARDPFLYVAAHGKLDTRGNDFEIAAKAVDGKTPLDPRFAFWFAKELESRLRAHNIKNKDGKVPTVNVKTFLGPYSGSPAIRRLRNGDDTFDFHGFGQNFQAVQLEISEFLRFNLPEKIGEVIQEVIEQFTKEFPDEQSFKQKISQYEDTYQDKLEREKVNFWSVKKVHFDSDFSDEEIGLPLSARGELGVEEGDWVMLEGIQKPLKVAPTISLAEQKKTGKIFRLAKTYQSIQNDHLKISKVQEEN